MYVPVFSNTVYSELDLQKLPNVMLVTYSDVDDIIEILSVGGQISLNCHQHLELVNNTFFLCPYSQNKSKTNFSEIN